MRLKGNDTIGICLDQQEGTIKFIINGYDFGVAFENDELKAGEWYPAVAPIYKTDDVTLLQPLAED